MCREDSFVTKMILRTLATGAMLTCFAWGLFPAIALAADPITIGFGMSLTGKLAANGKMALLGMQIWEDDVNSRGGLLGRPVKLVYYDDPCRSQLSGRRYSLACPAPASTMNFTIKDTSQ
jgi:ABC-type branched-subunit amino acid transport system substrate-binding protein